MGTPPPNNQIMSQNREWKLNQKYNFDDQRKCRFDLFPCEHIFVIKLVLIQEMRFPGKLFEINKFKKRMILTLANPESW